MKDGEERSATSQREGREGGNRAYRNTGEFSRRKKNKGKSFWDEGIARGKSGGIEKNAVLGNLEAPGEKPPTAEVSAWTAMSGKSHWGFSLQAGKQ